MAHTDDLSVRLRRTSSAARAARQAHLDAAEARDQAIEDADVALVSMAEIGRLTGMAVSHVQRIVAKRTAARQARQAAG